MSKRKRRSQNKTRADPIKQVALCNIQNWELLSVSGYTPLSKNPEIMAGVNAIANLIGSMTIQLWSNTDKGDQRIKNALSRKIDIDVNPIQTRATLVASVVRTLLLEGAGNAVVWPKTEGGLIEGLYLVPPSQVSVIPNGLYDYELLISGIAVKKEDFIHVVLNPDPEQPYKGTGYTTELKRLAKSLNQGMKTKDAYLESKWKPSIIVKVDGMTEEFASKEGRTKLLEKYIESGEAGQPWLIPADGFDVEVVKPLSLNDLAIKDGMELDKRTVASILHIPPFLLGVGKFDAAEWNNFISTTVRQICTVIEQAYTKALIISPDWYLKFNYRSMLEYDIQTLSTVGANLYTRGIMDGNEVRDWIGLSPKEGLDELVILENYIPAGMIGDQKKLSGGGEDDE